LLEEVLGGNRSPHLTVIAFELPDAGPADQAIRAEQAVSLIDLYTQAYRHQAVSAPLGKVVYMLVSDDAAPDPARLHRIAGAVVERSDQSLRLALRAGIGGTVEGPENVLASRQDADLVLRALRERAEQPERSGDLRIATLADVSSTVVLLRLQAIVERERTLLAGKLDALAAHDAKGHTRYLETLQAYLDALGDIPSAAASLDVHPNTYRYRLRRLIDLGGLDIHDPVERLVLHLQLHLRPPDDLAEDGPGQPSDP
jgi:sugar diacid utilization regulator